MQEGQLLMTQADRDRLVALKKAKKRLITQREAVRAQVFKVLTPEQQTQLAALQAQYQNRPHGSWAPRGNGIPSPAAQ